MLKKTAQKWCQVQRQRSNPCRASRMAARRGLYNAESASAERVQAMSLCVTNLRDGDSRAAFKNVTSQNMLFRERLKMFVHMHNDKNEDGQVSAFLRRGTDVTEHYYEVEVTKSQATRPNIDIPEQVWPEQNEIDIEMKWLIEAKQERDRQTAPSLTVPYSITKTDALGRIYRITV